jgi:hypothetical protein
MRGREGSRARRLAWLAPPFVALAAPACTGEQASPNTGLGEPVRVQSAQFVPGALPGSTQSHGDGGVSPRVTDVSSATTEVEPGELGLLLSGHATSDAQSVGVRFPDLGTGYWIVPVGAPDPTDDGLLTWQLAADFARDLAPGTHSLSFAAISADGASGSETSLSLCVDTPVPDNLNVCIPKRVPPVAVLSLSWDSPVDLDLVVQTPTGVVVGGKTATSVPAGASTPAKASNGVLDRDSNRDCVIDDIDREDIVWQSTPTTGTYEVWVDLFSACGKSAVSFNVSLWVAEPQPDGTQKLVQQTPPLATGVLTAAQANGGSAAGLFVGDFVLK